MAQVDTGLGWSAKDSWLIRNQGEIVASDVIVTGAIPIPEAETESELFNTGLHFGTHSTRPEIWYYIGVAHDSPACYAAGITRIGNNQSILAATLSNTLITCYVYSANHITGETWINLQSFTIGAPYPVSTPNFYYGYFQQTQPFASVIPVYATLAAFANSFVAEEHNFIKSNEGFAVACVAKWKTPTGTKFESPIIISTESEYTDMTTTKSGISLSKLNVLYNGRRFYMAFFDRPYDGNLTTSLMTIDRSYDDAPTFTLEQLFKYIAGEVYANILITLSPDPYQEGDGSGEDGGDGEEDDEDDVDFTDPPSTAIGATGFLTIFTPSLGQLRNLAGFMWNSFDVDNWRRLFANPMDAILGLHIIPVPPTVTGTKTVKVAGISTEIEMDYTTVRYIRRSMGTCDIPKKWGAYLDYNPYTKVSIFLPYIGFKDIDTDDIMGETIALQYMVDILTGACVAELKCGDTVLYSWQGNCANEVPITGSDWRGAIASALGIAGSVAATALTGGASAPMIAGTIASVGANSLNLKPSVNRSGAIAGSGGFMGAQRPYIIRTVPNLVIPADQNKFIGYPSFVNASLGSLTGYNEISAIHLEGIPATGNELSEIETLLKGGVIF